jgi:GH15 family glucan-1,4-alpha-glucosidase
MLETTDPSQAATDRLRALARHSHELITSLQDPGGAYPASPTFSAYRGYAWLRDGSFTAEGVSRYGDVASADRFHDWVDRTLSARAGEVAELARARAEGREVPVERMLPTRFTFDGANGSDPWWDFQTDGYGMWLWAVVVHARRHGLALARWAEGIRVATQYLTAFWDRPCYDWWEEHVEQQHVSTLGAVHAGLVAVADSGALTADAAAEVRAIASSIRFLVNTRGTTTGGRPADEPHLAKWLGSSAVDGSLPACVVPFGLVEPGSAVADATLRAVAAELDAAGGVHRFRADVFYGGGQWPLLSCLLGWNLAVAGDRDGALAHLVWAADQATPTGDLPEQVSHHLLHPEHRDEWVDRWGPVATPLLWSHGMFLILADELGLLPEGTSR